MKNIASPFTRTAGSARGRSIATVALAALVVVAAVAPPADAARPSDRLYVALGDSFAFGIGASDPATKGYPAQLLEKLRTPGVWRVGDLDNVSVPLFENSRSILDGQLSAALQSIDDPATDTRLVTLGIGGNDLGFSGPCDEAPAGEACGFVANYTTLLTSLSAALARDRGPEALVVLTYYNPFQGTPNESRWDDLLVGSDGRVDCSGEGEQIGLNDLIACIGQRFGARPVDIYPPLEGRIPELSAAITHLNDTGYALVAQLVRSALRAERPHRAQEARNA
jgi:lysophospholipase L1-like esterase